ncbi:SARP family transcriptional regulator, partial [Glycomyces tenuis]|uniref:ATP-binding protein n=4 Tax=Glycomyces tenuis TaxID=58116 RepID=UPI000558B993
ALPHHRTLRAVVDWSWDLLSEAERRLLRRLSVFTGGVSLEAAERVCPEGEYALDLLTSLTEKSLLRSYGEGAPRYRMLGTIREYAAQRLAEAGEAESARQARLAHVTELAETADPHLRRAEQLEWLAALEAEHDDIGAALRGAVAEGRAEEAMRLAGAAGWYWYLGGHRAEGTELAVAAASLEGEVPDEVRALVYNLVALFLSSGYGGDQYRAREWIEKAHRSAERSGYHHPMLGFVRPLERMLREPENFLPAFDPLVADADPWVRAQARLARGRLRLSLGRDETDVDDDIETALAEFRALGDRWGVSSALTFLADRLAARGEFASACEHYEEAIAALTALGSTEEVVGLRTRQARLYWMLGDERSCDAAMARARRFAEGITWPDTLAELAFARAQLALWRGEPEAAREQLATVENSGGERSGIHVMAEHLRGYLAEDLDRSGAHRAEALRAAVELGYPPMIAQALVGIADLAMRRGDEEQAVRLLAASDGVRGTPDRSQPDADRIAEDARSRLGETAFAEAVRDGQGSDWRELAEVTLAR